MNSVRNLLKNLWWRTFQVVAFVVFLIVLDVIYELINYWLAGLPLTEIAFTIAIASVVIYFALSAGKRRQAGKRSQTQDNDKKTND